VFAPTVLGRFQFARSLLRFTAPQQSVNLYPLWDCENQKGIDKCMVYFLNYDRDGYLFSVAFPVSDVKLNSDENRVTYVDQNGTHERVFGKDSAFTRFSNWICENNN